MSITRSDAGRLRSSITSGCSGATEMELVNGRQSRDRHVTVEIVDDDLGRIVHSSVVLAHHDVTLAVVAGQHHRALFRSGAGHACWLLPPSPYHQLVRRLEGPALEAYDIVPHELARRVRVMQVPFLPNRADGMTVGTWIFVRNDDDTSGNRALLAHELVHVRQFAEQGRARFLVRYVREYLTQKVDG